MVGPVVWSAQSYDGPSRMIGPIVSLILSLMLNHILNLLCLHSPLRLGIDQVFIRLNLRLESRAVDSAILRLERGAVDSAIAALDKKACEDSV